MTTLESGPAQTFEPVLERIRRAADMHELERAWCEGLRCHRRRSHREGILTEAAAQISAFGDEVEPLRLNWLRQVAEEAWLMGDRPLGEPLAAVAAAEMREAFAVAGEDLAGLRTAIGDGHDMHDYAEESPVSAMRIRDLGRIAERLRGSAALGLVSRDDVKLSIEFAEALRPRRPLVPLVPGPMRVSRDALLGWTAADRELPRLIRSLIAETEPSAEWLDMPAGTGVNQPGLDGVLRCDRGNRFVPAGFSVWELSAEKHRPDRKARSDYEGRVERIPSQERADMAYVAVLCAKWSSSNKRAFAHEKGQREDFRSVNALNVDDIEAWLECAPMTTAWLREQLGDPVVGVDLLSGWWAKWLNATTIPLDAGVVLAGRDQQADKLRDHCQRHQGGVITIGGNVHCDEILAFVAAALVGSEFSGSSSPEALYVDDPAAAQRLLAVEALSKSGRPSPHAVAMTVVVPSREFAQWLPAGSQHRMIVPVPGSTQAEIVLDAVDSDVVAQRMRATGVDLRSTHGLGSLARMSLLALKRHLAVEPALHSPKWATSPVGATLRRSLLLGGWDDSRDGDKQTVERFVDQEYGAVTEALHQLDLGDAPMITTGDHWHAVAPADTWALLAHHLTGDDIEAFGEVAHAVLIEPDPTYGMTELERMQAHYEGIRTNCSSTIKRGVATTLALMGSRPPTLLGSVAPSSTAAEGIVWRILRSANEDESPRTWAAVAEVLPLLAEAAPDQVLGALRTCLSEQHEFATAMFADSELGGIGSLPSPHLQVLNALEVMAWSVDHLMAVSDLLARLAEIDPGGRYANRPDDSLSTIMCAWKPHTAANANERLAAIRMLRRSHNRAAWPLMLSMLPDGRSSQMHKDGPRFRDWDQQECPVTREEHSGTVTLIAEMLLEDVGSDPSRWVDLIGVVAALPKDTRAQAIKTLDRVAASGPDETFKSRVFTMLRTLVSQHRQHSDAQWALDESELATFDAVLERLRPIGPISSYGDLFSPDVEYIDGVGAIDGWDAFQAAIRPKQTEAIEAILADGDLEAVLAFAMEVEQPGYVGIALARAKPELDDAVLKAMHDAPGPVTSVGLGYFEHRFTELGWDGIDQLIASNDLPPQVVADLHRAVPAEEAPWNRVDAHGGEVAGAYWKQVSYFNIRVQPDLSELLTVSCRLRQAGRIELAQELLTGAAHDHESDPEFAEEVAACLEQWIQSEVSVAPAQGAMVGWALTSLMEVLDRHREHLGVGRLARIEWLFFPLLGNSPGFPASNLYRALAEDPDFFVWMVELAYKPAGAPPSDSSEPTEADRRMALNAHQVLHAWPASQFRPGPNGEDRVDADSLDRWVDDARKRLAEIDRTNIGDRMIGLALAASPADPDGHSPGEAVRNLIEQLQSDDIDGGISEAIVCQRGGTFRSLTGGGNQERALAESYRERARRFKAWPRTADILAGLASSYEHIAEMQDRRAEATRRSLPL